MHSLYQRLLNQLRAIRISKGLSQEDVGVLLGRNQSYVSRCESGERRLSVLELIAFAEIYETNLATFFTGENYDEHE
jgi:transcriptional regulator with XRE-family HTH domain